MRYAKKAGPSGKMAAKSFASRVRGSRRFLNGFVAGAVVGAVGAGLTVTQFLWSPGAEAALAVREPDGSPEKAVLEQFGFPLTGTETRHYTNHALSYDQAKRVPRWVLEHISKSKIMGDADRKHCKFKPDPNIPPTFSAFNEDYVGSGWSRGHMAPAGNNKFSSKAMAETFYLSNIVPQNFDNNAGYWNRIEMYCRELTERFEDVWIVSGPLTLPQTGRDGKKTVSYQIPHVIGEDNVAVPSHLYKVILARRSRESTEPLALGAFVVPNEAIGFQPQLSEFQVSLQDLEKWSGLVFFPHLDRTSDIRNICSVDTCKLLDFREFTLYLSTRKIEGARSVLRLEKVMENLRNAGIDPDDYFMSRYEKKLEELKAQEQSGVLERKPS
ncbi:nuclease EXOG, mitochondrial isoform X1 [Camelus ferus]|uniref:Nuclease EXOG, mitochondrial n=2 Tax=Camelus TaxID=9836 RepID=A0A9W3FS58_CAMBA|nr:nuclease EXOG, mitochondrial isoform X1 [Camelus ferus]XP_045365694.1 nuclease EXOG, mitochondrial isoform X1 [Camelus bactrianus]XP_045365695.1 nuclease EXOG, mitochondrial isoform X1 [Camelus bactrianus]XP_045365696.1 nuclease EXOG, mitochondrial isoform X1 [Camelus bactrianus]XP_045365697.1 nuclease EXOG, mitochondrial isoform X1 [Camelus bactrianus]XP_045365698.1 nuclease EXOG, mitochondrial isoform X1 [Camelus bactrianus]